MSHPEHSSELTYTPPASPHDHWQITDEHGNVLVCPHQPPSAALLERLGLAVAPAAEVETRPTPTPADLNRWAQPLSTAADPETGPDGPVPGQGPGPESAEVVWSTATGQRPDPIGSPYSQAVAPSDLDILPAAAEIASEKGITREDIAAAMATPDRIEPGRGDAEVRYGGGLRIIVGADSVVLRVEEASHGVQAPSGSTSTRARPGSSKGANRVPLPTTRKEFIALLESRGFVVSPGGKHASVTHPEHPGQKMPLPLSPSDHRWAHNQVAQTRSVFGIDLRLPPKPSET